MAAAALKAAKASLKDRFKWEAVARFGLAYFIACCLAAADIPEVVPRAFNFLIPLIVGIGGLMLPKTLFILAGALPSLFVLILMILCFATLLLCAATVSDGLYVAIFAVFAFWTTSFHFSDTATKTSTAGTVLITFSGFLSNSFRTLVQNPPEGSSGMDVIGQLWTASGLTNPYAAYHNFLVMIGWTYVCFFIMVLVPPWRTMRALVSRKLLPLVIVKVANHLEDEVESEGTKDDTDDPNGETLLIHLWNTLGGGSIAGTTLFEPRMWRNENLVPLLHDLAKNADKLILSSLLFNPSSNDQKVTKEVKMDAQSYTQRLSACAKALSSNDATDLKASLSKEKGENDGHVASLGARQRFVEKRIRNIEDSVLLWIEAMDTSNPPPEAAKASTKDLLKNMYVKWLLAPFSATERWLTAPKILLHPGRWDIASILWSTKVVLGYVAVLCMSVYWISYSQFRIDVGKQNDVGAIYAGWNMIAYGMSMLATVEGSTKKGMMRIIGTGFGGFSAWLGIIICSGSYVEDDPNRYGLVAWVWVTSMIVVWFSVDGGVGSLMGGNADHGVVGLFFFVTQSLISFEVLDGMGSKNGLVVNRIIAGITGVAIAVCVQNIPPAVSGNDPKPAYKYLKTMEDSFQDTTETLMATEGDALAKFRSAEFESVLDGAAKCRRKAGFLRKDADKLNMLPFAKIDPALLPLLESFAATEALLQMFLDYLSTLEDEDWDPAVCRDRVKEILNGRDESLGADEESASRREKIVLGSIREICDRLKGNHADMASMIRKRMEGGNNFHSYSM